MSCNHQHASIHYSFVHFHLHTAEKMSQMLVIEEWRSRVAVIVETSIMSPPK